MQSILHSKRYLAASLFMCLLAKRKSPSTFWNYTLRDRSVAATAGLKYSQNNVLGLEYIHLRNLS